MQQASLFTEIILYQWSISLIRNYKVNNIYTFMVIVLIIYWQHQINIIYLAQQSFHSIYHGILYIRKKLLESKHENGIASMKLNNNE